LNTQRIDLYQFQPDFDIKQLDSSAQALQEQKDMVDLWLLSETYIIPALRDAAVMAFHRIANSERKVLDLATHRYIYEKTENKNLRLLSIFHCYLSLTPEDINKLSEGVLPWQLVKDVWCF
jgi:hypothetical protein